MQISQESQEKFVIEMALKFARAERARRQARAVVILAKPARASDMAALEAAELELVRRRDNLLNEAGRLLGVIERVEAVDRLANSLNGGPRATA